MIQQSVIEQFIVTSSNLIVKILEMWDQNCSFAKTEESKIHLSLVFVFDGEW